MFDLSVSGIWGRGGGGVVNLFKRVEGFRVGETEGEAPYTVNAWGTASSAFKVTPESTQPETM